MDARRLVGLNLRRLRTARGLSQEALALEAQIDRTYVSGIERGIRNPTVGLLDDLAGVLKVEIVDFFAKCGEETKQQ